MPDDERRELGTREGDARGRHRVPRWPLLVIVLLVVGGHGLAVLRFAPSRLTLPATALLGVAVLLGIKHLGIGWAIRLLAHRRQRP